MQNSCIMSAKGGNPKDQTPKDQGNLKSQKLPPNCSRVFGFWEKWGGRFETEFTESYRIVLRVRRGIHENYKTAPEEGFLLACACATIFYSLYSCLHFGCPCFDFGHTCLDLPRPPAGRWPVSKMSLLQRYGHDRYHLRRRL